MLPAFRPPTRRARSTTWCSASAAPSSALRRNGPQRPVPMRQGPGRTSVRGILQGLFLQGQGQGLRSEGRVREAGYQHRIRLRRGRHRTDRNHRQRDRPGNRNHGHLQRRRQAQGRNRRPRSKNQSGASENSAAQDPECHQARRFKGPADREPCRGHWQPDGVERDRVERNRFGAASRSQFRAL